MAYLPVVIQKKLVLTSAQIKAINATPIVLISAPGAGKMITVMSATAKFSYGGSNVFVAGAGQTIQLYYNNNTTVISDLIPNPMITSSTNRFGVRTVSYNNTSEASGVLDNVNVALWNPIGTEISGNAANDNTIIVDINYMINTF